MKRKKVKHMATSTFNKRIVLGRKAAKKMAAELRKGNAPTRPRKQIKLMTEEEAHKWLKNMTSK